jgi:hypothetical protein
MLPRHVGSAQVPRGNLPVSRRFSGDLTFAGAVGCLAVACWGAADDQGVAEEKPPVPSAITVVRDVPYREGPSKRWRLGLVLREEPHGKPRPAVVVIHGGGWLEGGRSGGGRGGPRRRVGPRALGAGGHGPGAEE